MSFKTYRDLEVWQKAMDLILECYRLTNDFPKNEISALATQLQRAAVSIAIKIAEGRACQNTKDFIQHLSMAYASLTELETYLELAKRLKYVGADSLNRLLDKTAEIGRMLYGLRRALEKNSESQLTSD